MSRHAGRRRRAAPSPSSSSSSSSPSSPSGDFWLAAMRMILRGRDPAAPETSDAIHVVARLLHAYAPGGMTADDKLALRRMREVDARWAEPTSRELRACYVRAVVAVETAARSVAATGDPRRKCELAQGLMIGLAAWFDPRMVRSRRPLSASGPTPAIVELLESFDPRASGRKHRRGAVRILAALIVEAGGLDHPSHDVEHWARTICTAVGRAKPLHNQVNRLEPLVIAGCQHANETSDANG